jgi:phosphoglycolate phosphatase
MERLILWDVDGTLLTTDGIAAAAMREAMREVVGPSAPMARTSYAGKTDWQIIRESLPAVSPAEVDERLHEFTAAYLSRLLAQRADLVARSRVFPGVPAVIEALSARAHQAPLTGNIAAVARLKLECVGLLAMLDVEAGAYGDDHHHRPELVPVAAARARARFGRDYAGPQIVVVGDTPFDIACGQLNGARTVAVATGPFTVAELQAHTPDAVLPDLSDTARAVAAILG